jgi:polar amino acid transport system substrate-binding protein
MNLKNMTISGYPWKRAVYMLKEGQADALFSANYTEEREKYAIYPKEPLIVSPWVVWVRTDSNIQFNVLNDLKGLNCGVVRGYSYTPEFWDFLKTKGRFSLVSDDETNFKKLGAKRIDYTVSELGNGLEIIKRLNLKDIIPLAGNPIKKDGLYIIFNKKTVSVEFADKFSQVLKEFKKTKDYKNIYNKYFR